MPAPMRSEEQLAAFECLGDAYYHTDRYAQLAGY